MNVERPVLRYFGGKWVLAPWVIQNLPAHDIYIEPFGGAASVLMRKPRVYHEVYNDLNDEIVNVFIVLRNKTLSKDLELALRNTPFARTEYDIAFQECVEPVERARRTIMKSFMGFGGDSCTYGKQTGFRSISGTTKRGTTPPAEWVSFWDCIPSFHERLSGVAIERRDAFELMPLHDSPEALFFVDPPYVLDTRGNKHGYKYEMTDEDHRRLCDLLKSLKGMVVLSGYDSDIYDGLKWESIKRETLADGARKRTEVLWLNPHAMKAKSQLELCLIQEIANAQFEYEK
jgi:DNA adenine methylase